MGEKNTMSSPDLWHRIHELYVRGIYIGLRVDSGGLHAWMTDRHFLARADYHIHNSTALVMAQDFQRWLEAEAPKMRGRSAVVDYAQNTIGSSLPAREK
jgi:hypothetical protein